MTEASGHANQVLLQLSTLYRGDLGEWRCLLLLFTCPGETLRDITNYRNDVVQQYTKLVHFFFLRFLTTQGEGLYTDFLVPVARSLDPTMKEIADKKVLIKNKQKDVKKRMKAVEKNIFKVEKKSMSQAQLQEVIPSYFCSL